MPSDEVVNTLIERLDAHLAEMRVINERGNRVIERNEEAFQRNTRAFERNTRAFERNTRAWGHTTGAMVAVRESLEEMRDEIRFQTQAIWRMIDRLDDSGAQGA